MKVFPLLIACLWLITTLAAAQNPCPGNGDQHLFQANRIGAEFAPNGTRFLSATDEGSFQVPFTSSTSPSAIFASSPWIGGLVNGELKLAGATYSISDQDFYFGPLDPNTLPYELCRNFNRVWSVTRSDIENHRIDFASDGIINDTIRSIFGWPAAGNEFFNVQNGFDLPSNHHGGWAAFADNNQNGMYEPHRGEFPVALLKGKEVIPEAISWLVFNDQGAHTASLGEPIGVEIQLTIFGFTCEENYVLNNTLFNAFKIINQSQQSLDSAFFGVWTDYDLGCSEDDFIGSDSARNTEFVYNDLGDGDTKYECSTSVPTYGAFPPIQSMSYLSHPMHSFIASGRINSQMYPTISNAAGQYNALQGLWADGAPIRNSGNGYVGEPFSSETRFLFHGDPRDTAQWSWWQENISPTDVRTISSVSLGTLPAGGEVYMETAYTFHQDSLLNNLEQFGFMNQNIDSLLTYVDAIGDHCQLLPICDEAEECVWPGDFNHNGIADHFDMLYWAVMKEQQGSLRNGLINWQGHFGEAWDLTLPNGINTKHGDGNGNGIVNEEDIDRNLVHFLNTTPDYSPNDQYPEGPEILISILNGMSADGRLRSLSIETGLPLDVLGIAFEVEVDTSLYYVKQGINAVHCPADTNIICIGDDVYNPAYLDSFSLPKYMFVKTNQQETNIDAGIELQRLFNIFFLRPGKTLADVPDTVEVRLKNLIAIDANGNDLHIGANVLRIPKYGLTATVEPSRSVVYLFPNPVRDQLLISSAQREAGMILTLTGMPVLHFTAPEMENPIQIETLPAGMYYVQLMDSGSVARFVKE